MSDKKPRVSLGLPVYNGEAYLKEAIESVLAQTYKDFECIISDNASTDRTREICEQYAASDARIRYVRQPSNIGAGKNYNFVFDEARGEYFKWVAHDDIIAPEYVEKCVAALDSNKNLALAYSSFVDIDDNGKTLGTTRRNFGTFPTPSARFRKLAELDYTCEEVFGLIPSHVLRKTDLIKNYTDSDRTLLAELGLYGTFYEVPEVLFFHRMHTNMSTKLFSSWRDRMAWFAPALKGKITFPIWMQFFHYLEIIARTPLSFGNRISCYGTMVRWFWQFKLRLAKDILLAVLTFFRIPFPQRKSGSVAVQPSH